MKAIYEAAGNPVRELYGETFASVRPMEVLQFQVKVWPPDQ